MKRSPRLLAGTVLAVFGSALAAYALVFVHGVVNAGPSALDRVSTRIEFPTAQAQGSATTPPAVVPASPALGGEARAMIVSFRAAVARAAPSVVTVHASHTSPGALPLTRNVLVKNLASGVILDRDGYIVTNHHVIADASELAVELADGTLRPARIVGSDPASDLALLKIDAEGLQPIVLADLDDVAVGDVVLAMGNPFGVGQTVSQGIGFAIPADFVQTIAQLLRAKGRVGRGWLGWTTAAPPHGAGAVVVTVEREGPADRAGIEPGDLIVRVGGKEVRHPRDASGVVLGMDPGERIPIELIRNGRPATIDVRLAAFPAQPPLCSG